MDTKSKSLNKAAEWSVLGILCVVFTVVCTYTRIFWVYQRAGWYWGKRGILFFTVSFWVGLGFSAVLVILFLWRLYQMYKKNIFSGNWNAGSERSRKDQYRTAASFSWAQWISLYGRLEVSVE